MNCLPRVSAVLAAVLTISTYAFTASQPVVLSSPDGQLVLRFSVVGTDGSEKNQPEENGKLVYSLTFQGKPLIDESGLALKFAEQPPLGTQVRLVKSDSSQGTDDYALNTVKVHDVHDRYNSVVLQLEEVGGQQRKMGIEARAYDDGVAFRYVVPEQASFQDFQLQQEDTEFRLSTDATNWALALPNYRSSYESEYLQLVTSAFSNQGGVPSHFLIGLPLLIHEPGAGWMALMEADLENTSSMYVTNPSGSWEGHWFVSKLAPRLDRPEVAVQGRLPYRSAWRVLMVADNPGRLLESNLVYDLNPPSRIQDESWIRAGKASWNWWVNDVDKSGKPAYTTENMKYYVDFAAESGFPYMLLDAGWSADHDITKLNGKVDVPELVRYAATRNVKVWIWLYAETVQRQMKEAFPLYEKWGVAGVKIDFVNRDDQEGIQFYYDVSQEAARHHLMIDFHGTRTPWGLERTYPNVLSFEGVLGLENNKVGRRDSPVDRTVFAFTRLLAGPMDYTPGGFNNATEDGFVAQNTNPMVMGTRAQQLALYVIFQSGLEMVSDSPQAYAGQPAFQFLKDVPASWDEMRVLNGSPGEFITIARRHGKEWYLGSMTNWTPRTLTVPLDFLPAGTYMAQIYEDAPDAAREPKHVAISKKAVTRGQVLTLHLAPGGGCAIRIVPTAGK